VVDRKETEGTSKGMAKLDPKLAGRLAGIMEEHEVLAKSPYVCKACAAPSHLAKQHKQKVM
jgi:hypothetical protein